MNTLLIFLLNRSLLDIVEKNQKPGFLNLESPSRFCIEFYTLFRIQVQD